MADLYHVVLKDHENSGYVWDEFFCPTCLEKWVTKFQSSGNPLPDHGKPAVSFPRISPAGQRTQLPRVRRHLYPLIQSIPMSAW